jgi:tungstate transport system substrate-binding protein
MNRIFTIILILLININFAFAEDRPYITLSSTTSTDNSGLLDYLIPKFKEKTGIDVRVIAVGTGRALKLGERGDTDIVLVHHRASEEKFVANGFGIERRDVMYNDYVIVGPKEDPANIKSLSKVIEAFKQINQNQVPFVSRGDDSGTHKKEIEIWKLSNINISHHSGDWYLEAGAGMGTTLNIANGMNAYTMSDRGTWLSFKNRDELTLLFENDPPLFNQYGVILVNPERHGHIKFKEAKLFSDWLTSSEGQQAIAEFTLEGQQLFFPNAQREIATAKTK